MSGSISFRPLQDEHLPLAERWLSAPHVRRWIGHDQPISDIMDEYRSYVRGESKIRAFLSLLDDRPIGICLAVRMGDFPEYQRAYRVDDPETANCDVYIGELDALHRGVGVELVRGFMQQVIFADPRVTTCVIDPVPDNSIAIRCYEKAGFRFLRALADDCEGNALYLMVLQRSDLSSPPSQDAIFLRPARSGELRLAEEIDDDACSLYTEAGVDVFFGEDHPFPREESARWASAIDEGRLLFACSPQGDPIGFIALGLVDQRPYVHQISVRRAWGRQGVGKLLFERAFRWAVREGEIWLTTWAHIPWNGPWYSRLGFEPIDTIGPEMTLIAEQERRWLPLPEQRIVMRKSLREI
ncbi:MAG: GNAT family N-acetyltransferase [Polyangiaceae bacterium]